MKKKFKFLSVLLMMAMFVFVSCSDDDDVEKGKDNASDNVPEAVVSAFQKQFPAASDVKWAEKDTYYVATFDLKTKNRANDDRRKNEAWYTKEGKCNLSELEISSEELEANYTAVFAAWKATVYFAGGYKIDDIDLLQRTNDANSKIVKIEIEKGKEEYDLYFTLDGKLVKEVMDSDADNDDADDDDNLPCPQELIKYVEEFYKGAVIVDFEKENEKGVVTYEVEILTKMGALDVKKELIFDKDFKFIGADIDIEDEILAGLIKKFLTPEQMARIVEITGESDPEEWDIEIMEDTEGFLIISVEDKNDQMVEIIKLDDKFQPVA